MLHAMSTQPAVLMELWSSPLILETLKYYFDIIIVVLNHLLEIYLIINMKY